MNSLTTTGDGGGLPLGALLVERAVERAALVRELLVVRLVRCLLVRCAANAVAAIGFVVPVWNHLDGVKLALQKTREERARHRLVDALEDPARAMGGRLGQVDVVAMLASAWTSL